MALARNRTTFVAVVLVALAAVTTPLTLTAYFAGRTLFSGDRLAALITDTVTGYDEAEHGRAVREALSAAIISEHKNLPLDVRESKLMELNFTLAMIGGMEPAEINSILKKVLRKETVSGMLHQVTDPLDDWLNGNDIYPDITLATAPLLEGIKSAVPEVIAVPVRTLPNCNFDQLDRLRKTGDSAGISDLPECAPSKESPELDTVRAVYTREAAAMLAEIPSVVPLNEVINPRPTEAEIPEMCRPACIQCHQHGTYRKDGHKDGWIQIKSSLLGTQRALSLLWLLPLVLFLAILALTVRSGKDLLKWGGWTFTLSGLLSLILVFFAPSGLETLLSVPLARYVMSSIFAEILSPARLPAVVLLTIGLAALSSAYRESLLSDAES